jgi:hypothetical protein
VGFSVLETNRTIFSYISMIVLTTSLLPQTFALIPRSGDFDSVEITDDQTNETTVVEEWEFTAGDYYSTLEVEVALVENHFYNLVLKDGTNIVYRDRIFCTDQPIVTFSVNNGQYVSNATTNTFIVYE